VNKTGGWRVAVKQASWRVKSAPSIGPAATFITGRDAYQDGCGTATQYGTAQPLPESTEQLAISADLLPNTLPLSPSLTPTKQRKRKSIYTRRLKNADSLITLYTAKRTAATATEYVAMRFTAGCCSTYA